MANADHAVEVDEESVAFVTESAHSDQQALQSSGPGWRAVIGTLALTACAALVVAGSWSSAPSTITARSLLDHPMTVDILTDDLMTLEHHDISEKPEVHAFAEQAAHDHVAQLRDQRSDAYKKLDSMEITEEHKNAALRTLQSFGDLRMHEVRKSVMAAIKDTLKESGDKRILKRHLVERLAPQTETMRELYSKYFTHLPRGPVANGVVLQEHHLDHKKLVKSFDEIAAQLKSRKNHASILSRKLTDSSFIDDIIQQFEDMFGSSSSGLTTAAYNGNDVSECLQSMLADNSGTDPITCMEVALSLFSGES